MPIIHQCQPRRRCGLWRTCQSCAAKRQAQIADIAERGAIISNTVTYAVIRTFAENDIKADKATLVQNITKHTDGGIWSIEKGEEVNGLHINMLIGAGESLTADQIANQFNATSDTFAKQVHPAEVRNVAAYITKQSSMPSKEEFSGRLYGSFGSWKIPIGEITSKAMQRKAPALAAAGFEYQLEKAGIEITMPRPETSVRGESRTEKRERHQRNKKASDKALQKANIENREAAYRNHLKKVVAIAAGEIEAKGFAYIEGHGIVTKKEMERLGITHELNDHIT